MTFSPYVTFFDFNHDRRMNLTELTVVIFVACNGTRQRPFYDKDIYLAGSQTSRRLNRFRCNLSNRLSSIWTVCTMSWH